MKVSKYALPLRLLHWLMALSLLSLIAVGWYMEGLEKSAFKWELYGLHKSFGVLLLALWVLRVLARRSSPVPSSVGILKRWEIGLSHATHSLLYLLMLALPLSGFIMSTIDRELAVFGWVVPTITPQSETLGSVAHTLHGPLAYTMLGLVLLHIAGAVKHRWLDQRHQADVLARML
ncbi:cytochrome b [Ferrimonas pelagia]|uniref:Cytochrome b n=1 Tax=Ferrimonas pelagia TaxID=1177826 RepID=A0ABP9F5D8_9GAMM